MPLSAQTPQWMATSAPVAQWRQAATSVSEHLGNNVLNAGPHQRAVTKDAIHSTELSRYSKELYQPKVDCDNSDAQLGRL